MTWTHWTRADSHPGEDGKRHHVTQHGKKFRTDELLISTNFCLYFQTTVDCRQLKPQRAKLLGRGTLGFSVWFFPKLQSTRTAV
jgi:hypothetical protein